MSRIEPQSSSSARHYDVIVIGGGASGMMAAGRAHERGLRVLIIEKNETLGKKLSITGGGRCNVTNAEFDTRAFLSHYDGATKFLHSPFSQFGVQDTFDFFTSQGLPLVVEERKRVFPETHQASDVTNVMVAYATKPPTTVACGVEVKELMLKNSVVTGVHTSMGTFTARSIIVATGGLSRPETGSTGDGFAWLRTLGHTIHVPSPDLVPLTVRDAWVRSLSGLTLEDIGVTFGVNGNGPTLTLRGRVLCTHFGFSGPMILNASREVKKLLKNGEVNTVVNLFPGLDRGALEKQLVAHFELHKNKTLENALKEFMVHALVSPALLQSAVSGDTKVHSVTKEMRTVLLRALQGLKCTVIGTRGLDHAIVSDGGIDIKEIDTRTMASRLYANVYVTGDMLNINRPSGGFSLQLCWTTGFVAGTHC